MEVHKGLTDCPICGKVQSKVHKLFFSCPPPSPPQNLLFSSLYRKGFIQWGENLFSAKKMYFIWRKVSKSF